MAFSVSSFSSQKESPSSGVHPSKKIKRSPSPAWDESPNQGKSPVGEPDLREVCRVGFNHGPQCVTSIALRELTNHNPLDTHQLGSPLMTLPSVVLPFSEKKYYRSTDVSDVTQLDLLHTLGDVPDVTQPDLLHTLGDVPDVTQPDLLHTLDDEWERTDSRLECVDRCLEEGDGSSNLHPQRPRTAIGICCPERAALDLELTQLRDLGLGQTPHGLRVIRLDSLNCSFSGVNTPVISSSYPRFTSPTSLNHSNPTQESSPTELMLNAAILELSLLPKPVAIFPTTE